MILLILILILFDILHLFANDTKTNGNQFNVYFIHDELTKATNWLTDNKMDFNTQETNRFEFNRIDQQ